MPPRRRGTTPDRHFRADDALYLPAQAKAQREGRSLSWVIRRALHLYLDNRLSLTDEPPDSDNPPPG